MAVAQRSAHAGFTLIELMITVAIVAILASIGMGQWREYTRRARLSEVLLAITNCKTRISEGYLSLPQPPASAGAWGCDSTPSGRYLSALETSVDGAIRVTIANLDPAVNGLHVHLVPVRSDGTTALTAAADLGNAVGHWRCGSDAQQVRNALPPECRTDTAAYADATFE